MSDVDKLRRALPDVLTFLTRDANDCVYDLTDEGDYHRGTNPWHGSSTGTNFVIADDGSHWHCHSKGCDASSDIFGAIARDEGIVSTCSEASELGRLGVFPEVLSVASDMTGVKLGHGEAGSATRDRKRWETVGSVLDAAADWYHSFVDEGDGVDWRKVLNERYGLSNDLIDEARIGYAPAESVGRSELFRYLRGEGFSDKDIFGAGVCLPARKGGGIDFFNGRIVFPYLVRGTARYFIARKTAKTPENKWELGK